MAGNFLFTKYTNERKGSLLVPVKNIAQQLKSIEAETKEEAEKKKHSKFFKGLSEDEIKIFELLHERYLQTVKDLF